MEQEEGWIRKLKGLNVLPLIVCSLLFILLLVLGYEEDFKFIPITLFSIISYSLIYFTELEEQKSIKITLILALNLISTTFWLIIFCAWSFNMFTVIDIVPILFSAFIVGYPMCMLYYNFRLFMNEISKPEMYDGFPNPLAPMDGVERNSDRKSVVLKNN
jgi:hypothetical protein